MVYIFDPTTCEEPKKPTYRYSPIPKTVKYCCCPNPTDYEEDDNTTEGGSTNQPVLEIPDKNDDNNSEGNTDIPEGGNTEVPPKVETRVTEREVTGTIRTRFVNRQGQQLTYDLAGQQAPAEVTQEWLLNGYPWIQIQGNIEGIDSDDDWSGSPVNATNEVPVGKYVTTETLTDGVVTNTVTEFVDYKVPYDVRGLKAWEISGGLLPGSWVSISSLPESEGGVGNGTSNTIEGEVEWFKKFFAHDGTDGTVAPTGFLKEGETVVTFLYENEEFFKPDTGQEVPVLSRDL